MEAVLNPGNPVAPATLGWKERVAVVFVVVVFECNNVICLDVCVCVWLCVCTLRTLSVSILYIYFCSIIYRRS